MTKPVKPDYCTQEMLDFLYVLRETGVTNMFGATPYILDEFPELDKKQAQAVLKYWMETYEEK